MAEIVSYQPEYAKAFKDLNTAWLEKYFVVEPYDSEVLSNPETYILDKGGNIYFVIENEKVVGTVALMYNGKEELEFTKMAVEDGSKGKGFGNQLLQHCITEAEKMGCKDLYLYSSRKLEPAINLYRKFGFEEIPVGVTAYERCDIKMVKHLK